MTRKVTRSEEQMENMVFTARCLKWGFFAVLAILLLFDRRPGTSGFSRSSPPSHSRPTTTSQEVRPTTSPYDPNQFAPTSTGRNVWPSLRLDDQSVKQMLRGAEKKRQERQAEALKALAPRPQWAEMPPLKAEQEPGGPPAP